MLTQNLLTKTASRDWPNWIFLQGCCIVRCVILFSPLPLYVNVSFHVHFYMCVDVLYVMCVWQDLLHGRIQMKTLTNKWYEEVRQGPSGSEDDEDEAELLWTEQTLSVHKKTMNGHCVSWTEGVCVCVCEDKHSFQFQSHALLVCSPATKFMWQRVSVTAHFAGMCQIIEEPQNHWMKENQICEKCCSSIWMPYCY